MSSFNRVKDQIMDIVGWFDANGINIVPVVHVSYKTMDDMLGDSVYERRYTHNNVERSAGFQRLCLQTAYATFYIDPTKGVEDDDIQMKDISGNTYSYNEHYINSVVEGTLLGGET